MSSTSYAEIPAATMQAAFPAPPEATLGTPTLFVLNDLLQYMCKCVQMHKSTISKKMNLLYVTVNPDLYKHYACNEAYPVDCYPFPANVPDMPDYAGTIDLNDHATRKCTHGMALKKRNDIINMNVALINAFLDLIPVAFKQAYEQKRMEDPNAISRKMFDWFVFKYGRTLAEDRKANRTVVASEWHPSMGFELLAAPLFCRANLAKYPINDDDIVDIDIRVLHRTGLFSEEYKTWILRSKDAMKTNNFTAFRAFWADAVNIVSFTLPRPAPTATAWRPPKTTAPPSRMLYPTLGQRTRPHKRASALAARPSTPCRGRFRCSARHLDPIPPPT
jgi:hypothetical protein